MDNYVTGETIKKLREKAGLTQAALADRIGVSDKTVSKWETARGLPDISLIEPLAKTLGVSLTELVTGQTIINSNRAANMAKLKLYVCPICGNVLFASGEAAVSCCGVTLPPLEPEESADGHRAECEIIDGERFVTIEHGMSKTHFISFAAYVTDDTVHLKKFYPEGGAQASFSMRGRGILYFYCNRHGLFRQDI